MSSTTLRVVAIGFVLLAVVLAVLGYRVSRTYAQEAQEAQQQTQATAQQTLAVVALKPLAAYKEIARDAVALVPVSVPPAAPYTSIDEVVGKVPLIDVDAGAPVTQRYFKEGNVLARIIPAGQQAVSVEINDVVAVGGFVRPGDVVDVLLYLRGGAGVSEPQSRVLLEGVRVLAYEERIIDRPEGLQGDDADDKKRSRVRTAVLAVPDVETTKLMLGASLGELRLALHSQNTEVAAATGASADQQVPDKAISVAELSRLKPAPTSQKPVAPPPPVEIYRGAQRESVTPR